MDADAVEVAGVWWRHVPHGGDPLFRADPVADGRWQRGEVVAGVYFADDDLTAWAEWYRALAEFAIPPDRQMQRDLWRWEVELEHVADLSDVDRLARMGLSLPRPSQRDWPAFQEVGEDLWREGFRGVLAPSAARPGHLVLCVFRSADDIVGATPLRPPITFRRAPAPPTGMAT